MPKAIVTLVGRKQCFPSKIQFTSVYCRENLRPICMTTSRWRGIFVFISVSTNEGENWGRISLWSRDYLREFLGSSRIRDVLATEGARHRINITAVRTVHQIIRPMHSYTWKRCRWKRRLEEINTLGLIEIVRLGKVLRRSSIRLTFLETRTIEHNRLPR